MADKGGKAENVGDTRRTTRALFEPKVRPLVAQPGAEVERFDDAPNATRIEKSGQSSPSKETKFGYPETERVRGARARA